MNHIHLTIRKVIFGGTALLYMLFGYSVTNADDTLTNPLKAIVGTDANPYGLVSAITNYLFTIAAPICGLLALIGGFQMMTASGNPEKFSKGKDTLVYAAIGFVIVLFASGTAMLIKNILAS